MLKYNNYQLSQPSEKKSITPTLIKLLPVSEVFFLFFSCTYVCPVWFQLHTQPTLIPHSCLLKVTSLCMCLFQSSRYGLETLVLLLGHEHRLEELTVVFKNLFLKLKNVVPDLAREHLLKKEGWSTAAVSTIPGISGSQNHSLSTCHVLK